MKLKDYTGQKIGKLTILYRTENHISSSGKIHVMWHCKCDCGNFKDVSSDYLRESVCPSCECEATKNKIEKNRINHIGQKFHGLTILDIIWDEKPVKAVCKCDCGNDYIGIKADVVSGHTRSCGCLQSEMTSSANTKDWTGVIAESGVKFIRQHHMNDYGQWVWECICPLCSNLFYELPAKVNNGHTTSCGCRIQSFGESYIQSLLENMKLQYVPQYTFDDCKNVYVLRFDFALFYDGKLVGLIEYDGKQHFESIEFFGGQEGLIKTKQRDEIKNRYCKTNNIPLLRIPYTVSTEDIRHKIYEYYLSLTTAGCV